MCRFLHCAFLGSKERDNETGLDYFLARYFSSVQGRFTSTDEFKGGPDELWVLGSGDPEKQALVYADVTNPQSLNKYQYCFNNPLRYVDPDGQDPQDGGAGRAEERLTQAYLRGEISREEYERQRQELYRAQATGALAALAIIGAVRVGPVVGSAVIGWMLRNPATLLVLSEEAYQMAVGNPTSLPIGKLTITMGTRLSAQEISAGGRLARKEGLRLIQSPHRGADFVDAVSGRSYDVMGGPRAFMFWSKQRENIFNQIIDHVRYKSADFVPIDLKGASKEQIKAIKEFVNKTFTEAERKKIIYLQ